MLRVLQIKHAAQQLYNSLKNKLLHFAVPVAVTVDIMSVSILSWLAVYYGETN